MNLLHNRVGLILFCLSIFSLLLFCLCLAVNLVSPESLKQGGQLKAWFR